MNFPCYTQIVDNSYVPSLITEFGKITNPQVGYKWYQSHPSSEVDVMAASPYFYPVSLPSIYCQVEYKPPEPPPTDFSISYASELSAYNLFDTSSERDLVAKAVVVQKDLMIDKVAVATQLFDKIPMRNSNSMDAKVSHGTSSGENVSVDALETTITGTDTFIQTTDRILLQMEEIKRLILQLSPPSNRGKVLPKDEVDVLIGSGSELHDVATDRKNGVGDVSVLGETVGFNRREKVACNEVFFKETELSVLETESNGSEENGDTTEEYEPWTKAWDWDDDTERDDITEQQGVVNDDEDIGLFAFTEYDEDAKEVWEYLDNKMDWWMKDWREARLNSSTVALVLPASGESSVVHERGGQINLASTIDASVPITSGYVYVFTTRSTEIVSRLDKLTNNLDDSVVMDSLLIHQNSSSIREYVEDFMHVKNKAEFIFKRDFDDSLLAYCFVNGLKEQIREALELWAPRTLQGAIVLAEYQASLLEERLLVEVMDVENEVGRQLVNNASVKTFGDDTMMKSGPLEVAGGENLVAPLKLLVAEKMPWIILTKMEESVLAFIDKEDKRFIPPIFFNDSQKQMTRDVAVMDGHFIMLMNEPTPTRNTYGLEKKPKSIAGEEAMLIFDPGGGMQNGQGLCILKFFKEMIKNEDMKLGEITMMSAASSSDNRGEFKQAHESIKTPFLTRINPENVELSLTVLGHLHLLIHIMHDKLDVQLLAAALLWMSNNWFLNCISSLNGLGVKYTLEHEGITYCDMSVPQSVISSLSAPPFSHLATGITLECRACLAKHLLENYVRSWLLSIPDDFMTNRLPRNAAWKSTLFYDHRCNRVSFSIQGDIALSFISVVSLCCLNYSDSFGLHTYLALFYTHSHKLLAGVSYDFNMLRLKDISDLNRHNDAEKQLDSAEEWPALIPVNQALLDQFQVFNICPKEIIPGLYIAGQLMGLLRWIPRHQSGGNSFVCGVTLVKLVAVTKEQGNITDYSDGAPLKLLRYVLPDRLVVQHDSNHPCWSLEKKWKDHTPMTPKSFGNGTSESGKFGETLSYCTQNRNYLVSTIVKRLAIAWFWSVTTLVFDPGKFCCYQCIF